MFPTFLRTNFVFVFSEEELPTRQDQRRRSRGITPRPRSGGWAGAGGLRGATPCSIKVRRGGREEIPLVQGKEQWLRFAGAAVERYSRPR